SAAPFIEPHELGDSDTVAQRERADQEGAQVAARAFADSKGFGHRELQERVAPFRMQAMRNDLDRLECQTEGRVPTGYALGLHLGCEASNVGPGLDLTRSPGCIAWFISANCRLTEIAR